MGTGKRNWHPCWGAAVECYRPIAFGLNTAHQIGQTGKMVNPDVYIALGISDPCSMCGVKTKFLLPSITMRRAPIMEQADYAVEADLEPSFRLSSNR